ncbi:MAG: hypothetical protein M1818_001139 [Claussenomyces sp. TS43310]|nr:MAG: hypothetical protein M1818_001139 [Claussenomyces sp. TS43310]
MSGAPDSPQTTPETSSASQLLSTLVPTFVIFCLYVSAFLILRRSHRRYYAPRTYLGSVRDQERTPPLPNGLFNWIGQFWKIPDTYALQHQSLDAYLFLRFLRILVVVMFIGCCITWPVLFPVNATGHSRTPDSGQLNILSWTRLDTKVHSDKNRVYAPVFVSWLFFGFVMYTICRESIFYINLRQAFLLSPVYANRISSRTVLFISVPAPYLDEGKLRKVFGTAVKNIWISGDTSDLDDLVEKRDKIAFKLEKAEVKLSQLANAARLKVLKEGDSHDEAAPITDADAESGSVAARWVSHKKRPTHRIGKFGLIGSKVDTINWCREQLAHLIPETEAAQEAYRSGKSKKIPAVFIEFFTQSEAQVAFQTLSHHQALHMAPRYIGINPQEVVWKSLKISWWQRVIRRYVVLGFIAALIIFWSIPVGFVGVISNINQLEKTFKWLAWLEKIPSVIMGVVTGLLPSVLLAVVMSLVPVVMRLCAKLAGEPSLARVELFTQNAYFAFQVIQVFLVVTIGSSASSAGAQIAKDPSSTLSLLANSIPQTSNFYLSYFVLQGLTIASGVVSQVVGFVIFTLLYKLLPGTPRAMYKKWTNLSAISWGSQLPVLTNIAVIALVYACIAPLVLGFATIGIALFYLAYRYNILFVTDSNIDTKGLIYPRALQQLFAGIYIAEVTLLALCIFSVVIGPIVLMAVFLVFTVLFHISMNSALDPLLYNLPKSLESEEESLLLQAESGDGAAAEKNGKMQIVPAPHKKPNILAKFMHPEIYTDYATLRRLVPHNLVDADSLYNERVEKNAYYPPSVGSITPLLWIARDDAGVSRQEIAHTSKVIPITDEGASFNEKNKLVWDAEGARPPIWEEKTYY